MDVERLRPEEKVDVAIDMSDCCVRICAEGIRAEFPDVTKEELVGRLRERIEWVRRRHRCGREV